LAHALKLSFHHLDLHLTQPWVISRGRTDLSKVVVVELTDHDGIVGRGEAAPISRYKESVKTVEAFLQKIDPKRLRNASIPETTAYLNQLSNHDNAAKCAVDIALVEINAKRCGKAIYDLLNFGFAEQKHSTSYSIGLGSPDEIRKKAEAANKYPILKLKLGGPDDRAALKALREVAPKKFIRVDANEAWRTKEEAMTNIEWLANDKAIQFVEQPLPASTAARDWIWLKQHSPLPIFGDESHHHAKDTSLASQCFHGVNVKLVKMGGITGSFEALKAARKAGLKTMLGCMIETSILISAAAHLAELADYFDLDGNLLITNDPYTGVTAENGILSFGNAPEKTGLRVTPRFG
jgi:L-alanine-DL-glutamate epimerase-like enolase superfamily enzyme